MVLLGIKDALDEVFLKANLIYFQQISPLHHHEESTSNNICAMNIILPVGGVCTVISSAYGPVPTVSAATVQL